MNKSIKTYLVLLVLLIVGISFFSSNNPKPINWRPSYSLQDKIPFGLYIFNQESKKLFKGGVVEKINSTPYEFFTSSFDYQDTINPNYTKRGTFLYINEYSNLDKESIDEMLTYASYGNTIFISAKDFPRTLLDTLKLNMTSEFSNEKGIKNGFFNRNFTKREYPLEEGATNSYFDKIDTLNTTVLGYVKQNKAHVNFIKIPFYDGNIILHNQPAAFTNFHLLKDDHAEYTEKVISYIPKGNVYWFVKDQNSGEISNSPMRFILSNPGLKWAWWIFLIGTLVFFIFNAKRKQRIVPILKPLQNTSLEFIKTIGNLYLQEGDHDTIIQKKIVYFLERIRNEYFLDTSILDSAFAKKLHQKSGKKLDDIEKVLRLINNYRKNPHSSTEKDLIEITNAIENILL